MLRETSLSEMVQRAIPRDQCVFVARKRGNDDLAPSDELYQDFDKRKKALERKLEKGSTEAHNRAFLESDYERRFRAQIATNPEALKKLEEISKTARHHDVFLVCYEGSLKACHRRVLLRIAEERFGAEVRIDGVEPRGSAST
jgi:uncharacterized protein YeaO (DUF488 family)